MVTCAFSTRKAQADHQCDVQGKDCIGTIKEDTLYEYVRNHFKVCRRCSIQMEKWKTGAATAELVTVEFTTNMPIRLAFDVPQQGRLMYYLAPRLEATETRAI